MSLDKLYQKVKRKLISFIKLFICCDKFLKFPLFSSLLIIVQQLISSASYMSVSQLIGINTKKSPTAAKSRQGSHSNHQEFVIVIEPLGCILTIFVFPVVASVILIFFDTAGFTLLGLLLVLPVALPPFGCCDNSHTSIHQ